MAFAWRARRRLLDLAPRLPRPVGRALMALNRWPAPIYGRAYARHARLLRETYRAYDNTRALLAVVNAAVADVPFYRDRSRPVRSIEEFEAAIATIDKDVVMASAARMTSRAVDLRGYERCSTGGTEGRPLVFLAPRDRHAVEFATMHALWANAGYAHHARAVIRNHRLPPGQDHAINPITREVIFDGFRLAEADLARICDVVKRLKIRFVHCYPSTAYELARFMRDARRDPSGIQAFLSGSENVFEHQRALIEDTLGIRFYTWYGHSEKLVLGGYCGDVAAYHLEPTYGYFELLGDDGQVVREPGGVGEIVGTTLHNPGMPLIRYRTGDRAEYVADHCEACGRRVPIIRAIRGRWSGEKIYRADGSFVTTTSLNLHAELNDAIEGLQYVQVQKGELTILVVRSPRFGEGHAAALRTHYERACGPRLAITITFVERLRRRPNGKFTLLMSDVNR